MINRDSIRRCFAEVIAEDKRDSAIGLDKIGTEILAAFDSRPEICSVATFEQFVQVLEKSYRDVDWSLFRCLYDLSFSSVLAQLPRQSLPALEVNLEIGGQQLSIGQTRIGGKPEWTQCPQPHEEYPLCSECNEIMAFVCQIDSLGRHNQVADAKEFSFAYSGTIFVFACLNCQNTWSSFQCD